MPTIADATRRWRVVMQVRTGRGMQDWTWHELAQLPPHTSMIEAITKAMEIYQSKVFDNTDLISTMFVRIDEYWLDDEGEVDEYYMAWAIGDSFIIESDGEEWPGKAWPPQHRPA